MRGRLIRLAIVSAIALGVIAWLASGTGVAHWAVAALLLGWLAMPVVLLATLVDRRATPLLLVPSTLVTLGVAATALNSGWSLGWVLVLVGIVAGDLLGAWLWLGLAPTPERLRDPLGAARWTLIGLHVAPLLTGLTTLAVAR